MSEAFDHKYWDDRYRRHATTRVREPNPHLMTLTRKLPPGRALDAGAGEGADARWLAAQGWGVTAVDISATALERARSHATAPNSAGARRVDWVTADLTEWIPTPEHFDLVFSAYVHTMVAQEELYRRLAAAVAPGGTLLIVGHHPLDRHTPHASAPETHVTTEEVAAILDQGWTVEVAATQSRTVVSHTTDPATIWDTVLLAHRKRSDNTT